MRWLALALGLGALAGCAHPAASASASTAVASRGEDGPAWRVLYGAGTPPRPGAPRGPECRVQADGQQVCGHHCRTGRDGRVACARSAEGKCEVGPDGRARCTEPAPARAPAQEGPRAGRGGRAGPDSVADRR